MSKNIIAFTIALVLHILVLGSSVFFIGKNPTPLFASKNSINLQFGEGKGHASKSSASPGVNKKSAIQKNAQEVAVLQSASSESTGGSEGSGPGSTFEASVVNYEGPIYPRIAQKRGIEGSVRIRIKVSSDGLPESTNILKTSGHEVLDQAALEVIPRWRFQKKDAPYFVEKNIVFQLKN